MRSYLFSFHVEVVSHGFLHSLQIKLNTHDTLSVLYVVYSVGVDNDFEQLLCEIFGADFMETFKTKRPAGYVDLMIAFESRKRSASPFKDMPLNVSLPFSFIDYYKKVKVFIQ